MTSRILEGRGGEDGGVEDHANCDEAVERFSFLEFFVLCDALTD